MMTMLLPTYEIYCLNVGMVWVFRLNCGYDVGAGYCQVYVGTHGCSQNMYAGVERV